jgi:hypothetical protein
MIFVQHNSALHKDETEWHDISKMANLTKTSKENLRSPTPWGPGGTPARILTWALDGVTDQLHSSDDLPPGRDLPVPIKSQTEWSPG